MLASEAFSLGLACPVLSFPSVAFPLPLSSPSLSRSSSLAKRLRRKLSRLALRAWRWRVNSALNPRGNPRCGKTSRN